MISSVASDQYVIYFNPKDHPDKYVVRRWSHFEGLPIALEAHVGESLEAVRSIIPEGHFYLPPAPTDDPCIVEVWI